MSGIRLDKELEQFRDIMKVPSHFQEGFSWASLVGAVFIALVMVPGGAYMGLLIGMGIGGSAQWVTLILFLEIARRAHKSLNRAEVYVLFFMASAAMGQPFQGLLYNQFYVQSDAAVGAGIAEHMKEVWWFAPTDPDVLAQRTFFHPAWYPVIIMIILSTIVGRFNNTLLTYGMFRLASDIEKLPFPMAPVGASGIVALAEQELEDDTAETIGDAEGKPENWRWRMFCIGSVIGMAFGVVYAALPSISNALIGERITIFPIPFADFTAKTSQALPAFATGWTWDVATFLGGMVMPFFAALGTFIGLIITMILNPLLYHYGMMPSWEQGMDTIQTLFTNNIDFYFSFSIGVSGAIAIAGFYQVYKAVRAKRQERKGMDPEQIVIMTEEQRQAEAERRRERGDIPTPLIIATFFVVTIIYICLSGWLIEWHGGVMKAMLFFGFIYTPLISYVTARLQGMAGLSVSIPMIREAAFLLSGYSGGVKIWFLPVPMSDYGGGASRWRQAELTGTKFWSIWKAEIILTPIVLIASILFAQFLWSLGPIPSSAYPYAQKMWPLGAANATIMQSATLGRFSQFEETFRPKILCVGLGFATVMFFVLYAMNLPILLIYGMVGGLNVTTPHSVISMFVGALIGRYYFQRKLGFKWRQYIPVIMAGYGCGLGLITLFSVGVVFMKKAIITIPY